MSASLCTTTLCPQGKWYRAALTRVANPFHVPSGKAINRFNDGTTCHRNHKGYRLLYFAPDPQTALLEVRAMLGFIPGPVAPASFPPRSWTVFQYQVHLGCNTIVDFGYPGNRAVEGTTIQEMTGDWQGYHLRPLLAPFSPPISSNRTCSPTQEIGASLSKQGYLGFLAPSARNPLVQNLVLYFDNLPNMSVVLTGIGKVTL